METICQQIESHEWSGLLKSIIEKFDCSTGTIHFIDEKDGLLHLAADIGIPEHILPKVKIIPVGKGIAGAAAERREPVDICNLQADDSGVAKPAAKDTKVSGSVAVPIIRQQDDKLLGTIGIGKYEPYSFTEAEKSELMQIASKISESR